MEELLLSVEQVAEHLGLHVKTVRGYVREGRLKAVRIGKQYRIAASDLATMTGRPVSSLHPQPVRRTRHVEVYTVVEVDAVSPQLSERVTTMMLGAASSRGNPHDDRLQVQAIYDAPRGQLKLILIGSIDNTGALLRVVQAMVEPPIVEVEG
ncbi:MAG TPA: helix-turn-helix domain-containing protein [Bryobacteraceae bacterium]|jgi:excisionase family DNA binding protein|nr:helix-turn-helix domain-containing protein [Bryobacteraceae bacterium]